MHKQAWLKSLALLAALAACAASARAHYLWLERTGSGAHLFFGEINEVREQSPGRLDEIAGPSVWTPGAAALRVTRRTGSFAIEDRVGGDVVAVEPGYAVQDWTRLGIGVVKPVFYARHAAWPARHAVPQAPELRLDVQPLPGSADTVRVLFDGQPLAGAKLVVHAPNGWDQEHKADAQGLVKVSLPWRGQYVLETIHKEAAAGEFQGRAYEARRHRATLSFVRRDGIDPASTGSLAPRHPER